jgi:3-isopropylmalate dehydrogenase
MTNQKVVVVLAGDGVGPECTAEAIKVLQNFKQIVFQTCLIGGSAIDAEGEPLSDQTIEICKNADGILLGAVGGPQWPRPDNPARPEQGLLKIRKELGLFANIRPCFFPGQSLLSHSPLKPEIVQGVEFTVVRELTGGIYFGERTEECNGIGIYWLI